MWNGNIDYVCPILLVSPTPQGHFNDTFDTIQVRWYDTIIIIYNAFNGQDSVYTYVYSIDHHFILRRSSVKTSTNKLVFRKRDFWDKSC